MIKLDQTRGFISESDSHAFETAELRQEIEVLRESWDEAAGAVARLRGEDQGWKILGQVDQKDGFSMRVLKEIAVKAEIQGVGNPLLKQGFQLRFNPIFSRGFSLDGEIKPRHQRKLDKTSVRDTLFSSDALDALERTCFNVGNLFVIYNTSTGEMMRVPFEKITNRAVDPDFPARTAYYQYSHTRTDFNGKTENIIEWLPVVEWKKSGNDTVDEIAHNPVNHEWTIIDMRVNVPTSGHWGIPDVFPALPYAWAYSEYIRDAASVLKALQVYAWRVVGNSKNQAQNAGVALASNRRVGSVAAMTKGTTMDSPLKAGQVDMTDGMALAAMVASGLGVPTPALIATVSGSVAAAVQSLDGPTVAMARARQERWVDFYSRVFLAMDIEDVEINFPKITEDPIHRQISSLAVLRSTGAIWADEYRDAAMEAMSITPQHPDAPDVEEYAQAANALGFLNWMEDQEARIEAEKNPIASQGNSGVAGSLGEIDNTSRNQARTSGAGTQTDLVG